MIYGNLVDPYDKRIGVIRAGAASETKTGGEDGRIRDDREARPRLIDGEPVDLRA